MDPFCGQNNIPMKEISFKACKKFKLCILIESFFQAFYVSKLMKVTFRERFTDESLKQIKIIKLLCVLLTFWKPQ